MKASRVICLLVPSFLSSSLREEGCGGKRRRKSSSTCLPMIARASSASVGGVVGMVSPVTVFLSMVVGADADAADEVLVVVEIRWKIVLYRRGR